MNKSYVGLTTVLENLAGWPGQKFMKGCSADEIRLPKSLILSLADRLECVNRMRVKLNWRGLVKSVDSPRSS